MDDSTLKIGLVVVGGIMGIAGAVVAAIVNAITAERRASNEVRYSFLKASARLQAVHDRGTALGTGTVDMGSGFEDAMRRAEELSGQKALFAMTYIAAYHEERAGDLSAMADELQKQLTAVRGQIAVVRQEIDELEGSADEMSKETRAQFIRMRGKFETIAAAAKALAPVSNHSPNSSGTTRE